MKRMMWTVAAFLIATWAAVAAQTAAPTKPREKMNTVGMMDKRDVTYTGCLEAGVPDTFTLTHAVAASGPMAESPMKEGSMKKDAMMSATLTLSSTSVDLSAHVGRQVSVTGSPAPGMDARNKGTMAKEPSAFTVKSVKTVAGACS